MTETKFAIICTIQNTHLLHILLFLKQLQSVSTMIYNMYMSHKMIGTSYILFENFQIVIATP